MVKGLAQRCLRERATRRHGRIVNGTPSGGKVVQWRWEATKEAALPESLGGFFVAPASSVFPRNQIRASIRNAVFPKAPCFTPYFCLAPLREPARWSPFGRVSHWPGRLRFRCLSKHRHLNRLPVREQHQRRRTSTADRRIPATTWRRC